MNKLLIKVYKQIINIFSYIKHNTKFILFIQSKYFLIENNNNNNNNKFNFIYVIFEFCKMGTH